MDFEAFKIILQKHWKTISDEPLVFDDENSTEQEVPSEFNGKMKENETLDYMSPSESSETAFSESSTTLISQDEQEEDGRAVPTSNGKRNRQKPLRQKKRRNRESHLISGVHLQNFVQTLLSTITAQKEATREIKDQLTALKEQIQSQIIKQQDSTRKIFQYLLRMVEGEKHQENTASLEEIQSSLDTEKECIQRYPVFTQLEEVLLQYMHAFINMNGKKGAEKEMEKKSKATPKPRQASRPSPTLRYSLTETDPEQTGDSTDLPGSRAISSSPVESESGSKCASDAGHDSSLIPEGLLKLEMALQSTPSSTPRKLGTSAVTELAALPAEHENQNDLSEIKVMITTMATAINDLKKDIRKEINGMPKTNKKLWQELLKELRLKNKVLEKCVYNCLEAAFKGMLEKIGHIQENVSKSEEKLKALGDQLENIK